LYLGRPGGEDILKTSFGMLALNFLADGDASTQFLALNSQFDTQEIMISQCQIKSQAYLFNELVLLVFGLFGLVHIAQKQLNRDTYKVDIEQNLFGSFGKSKA
jgi:hypothetical protein